MARAITGAAQLPICLTTNNAASFHSSLHPDFVHCTNRLHVSLPSKSSHFGRRFHVLCRRGGKHLSAFRGARAELRWYRKTRKRTPKYKEKELGLNVDICIEEDLPDDDEIFVYRASILRL